VQDIYLTGDREGRAKYGDRTYLSVAHASEIFAYQFYPVGEALAGWLIRERGHHLVGCHRLALAVQSGEQVDNVAEVAAVQSDDSELVGLQSVCQFFGFLQKRAKLLGVGNLFGQIPRVGEEVHRSKYGPRGEEVYRWPFPSSAVPKTVYFVARLAENAIDVPHPAALPGDFRTIGVGWTVGAAQRESEQC